MASVTHQALLMQSAAYVPTAAWYQPLSVAPKTTPRAISSINADGAWMAALAFAATGVKGVQWQQPLSIPVRMRRDIAGFNSDGAWLAAIRPTAVAGNVPWQQPLSVPIARGKIQAPAIIDPSCYTQAWISAAANPSTSFLLRTTGLDATHTNAYIALINGLVADGVWAKLDVLHIYATQDSTTALLNLVSTSFTAGALNSPTFTADRGYTGVSGSGTVFVTTNFNPSTASSPQFTRNSAHFSAWSATNVAAENHPIMGNIISGSVESTIYPRFLNDGKAYFRVNDSGALGGVTEATSQGHYIANRSSSTDGQGYKNGSSIFTTTSDNSIAVPNQTYYVCGMHINNGAAVGSAFQVAMSSIGSSLNSTEAGNFYTRLRTYMTAVGVP